MTDNTQAELDEILDQLHVRGCELADQDSNALCSQFKDQAKQSLLDWHNKEVEAVLDRLLEHGEDFTTFGDAGRSVAVEYIESERNKLKESSNDHTR